MGYETIIYESKDHIATIFLNRPDKLNAYNWDMSQELKDAVRRVNEDPDVRVLILGGKGRSFCSGHDRSDTLRTDAKGYPADWTGEGLIKLLDFENAKYITPREQLRTLRVPTIAMVQGHCIGGGFIIANMCDLIVASDDAIFASYVTRFGAAGVEELIEPWYMPMRKAKELLFTGNPIDAKEALRLGIVNRVVPRDNLEKEAYKLAKKIVLMPPGTIRLIKESLNRTMDEMGYSNAMSSHLLTHLLSHILVIRSKTQYKILTAKGKIDEDLERFKEADEIEGIRWR